MGNRRFAQVSTSDEEDEVPATKQQSSNSDDNFPIRRKRKKMKLQEEEEEEAEGDEKHRRSRKSSNKGEKEVEASKQRQAEDEDEDDQSQEDAKPIGDVVRVSGKGRGRKNHYNAFEYDGNRYDLVSFFVFLVGWWLVLQLFSELYLVCDVFKLFSKLFSIGSCMA